MTPEKTFWLIRHGESEGNVGLPTASAGEIPLTQRGKLQSERIAGYISQAPDLFVISSYIRTGQTAAPAQKKFPQVPLEIWDVHEYTYLSNRDHHNTTTAQRNQPALEYFRKSDATLVTGEGAESFNQFIDRVDSALKKIAESPHQEIYLFSHGWFIRALLWRLIFFPDIYSSLDLATLAEKLPNTNFLYKIFARFAGEIKSNPMRHFLWFSSVVSIPNGAILNFSNLQNPLRYHLLDVEVSHIPPSLRGSHLTNR